MTEILNTIGAQTAIAWELSDDEPAKEFPLDQPYYDLTSLPFIAEESGIMLLIKFTAKTRPVYLDSGVCYACDSCGKRLAVRYRCISCLDIDFCPECYESEEIRIKYCENEIHSYVRLHLCFPQKAFTFNEMIRNSCIAHSALPFVGQRKKENPRFLNSQCTNYEKPAALGDYSFLTFNEFYSTALRVGAVLDSLLPPILKYEDFTNSKNYTARDMAAQVHRMVLFVAENSVEWIVSYYACLVHNMVTLPVPNNVTKTAFDHIISTTSPMILVASLLQVSKCLQFIHESDNATSIRVILLLCTSEEFNHAMNQLKHTHTWISSTSIDFYSYEEVVNKGYSSTLLFQYPPVIVPYISPEKEPIQPDCFEMLHSPFCEPRLMEIAFTSGSTGIPKGAMIDECIMVLSIHSMKNPLYSIFELLLLPFCFGTGRDIISNSLINGGRVAIFSGDLKYVHKDLLDFKPTKIHNVPSFWNSLYAEYKLALSKGISYEEANKQFSQSLGPRIHRIVTGGAMTSPHVIKFLRDVFKKAMVFNAYGSTEAGGIMTNGSPNRAVTWKLRDVPEMNYYQSDTPYPRGELLVFSKENIKGYFKDDEQNHKHFEDGYYCTGDIVELRSESDFRIIDRKSNIIKLANGEFVSPTYLENIFLENVYVQQIYIHASPTEYSVVAIVEPANGAREITADEMRKKLRDMGNIRGLRMHELPCAVYLTTESFSVENGCLTASGKICRHKCGEKYRQVIQELYATASSITNAAPIQTKISGLLSNTLGYEVTGDSKFNLDSLAAVQLWSQLQQNCIANVRVEHLLQVQSLDELMNLRDSVNCAQTKDEQFLQDVKEFYNLPKLGEGEMEMHGSGMKNIFLTGATGVVGFYLLHTLLEDTTATIYCLVRCLDEANGIQRIKDTMNRLQPSFDHPYNCDWNRVRCVVGNLVEDLLGMNETQYKNLSNEIDCVFHSAAFVHWMADYNGDMKDVNVDGTKRIVDFCLETKPKTLVHISTITVKDTQVIPRLHSGYCQSKWLAELYVQRASGVIPVYCFRLGSVTGSKYGGLANRSDFVNRLICTMIELKKYPTCSLHLEYLPADDVAKTIFDYVKNNENRESGKIIKISKKPSISLREIAEAIFRVKGLIITEVNLQEFIELIENNSNCSLFPLFPVLCSPAFWHDGIHNKTRDQNLEKYLNSWISQIFAQQWV